MKRVVIGLLALLFTSLAVADDKVFHFCTGAEGGFYEMLGNQIASDTKRVTKSDIETINTSGSVESAQMLKDGDCDAAILQADAVVSLRLPTNLNVSDAHSEAIYWLHAKSGVKDFDKITQHKNLGVAVVSGSGALVTLRNFANADEEYKDLKVIEFNDWFSAAKAAAQGFVTKSGVRIEIAGMLYVGRPGNISSEITGDFADQLTIGEINESNFEKTKDANGNALYFTCDIGKGDTNGLKTDTFGAPDTFCMKAQVVYNADFFNGMDTKVARNYQRALDKAIVSNIRAIQK